MVIISRGGGCSCGSIPAPPMRNSPFAPSEAQLDPASLAGQYMSRISGATAGARGVLASHLAVSPQAIAATADFSRGTGTAVYAAFECCT